MVTKGEREWGGINQEVVINLRHCVGERQGLTV